MRAVSCVLDVDDNADLAQTVARHANWCTRSITAKAY